MERASKDLPRRRHGISKSGRSIPLDRLFMHYSRR
ncbi:uncharacterized protein CTRU02_209238 [Colletotrichum truncatum]|uniref:Uncharacterized protein n=1 Tax=Colletotrichum truncatum TaxID=5467 RepID=A0ACC3YZS2_COLTU|nr:uncharacterized protein CTRU02_14583 [Colletotrichum truncatum]KAF6782027.1 hypothetical protein CTRU02_14583 [Colletotrichum truncatum]